MNGDAIIIIIFIIIVVAIFSVMFVRMVVAAINKKQLVELRLFFWNNVLTKKILIPLITSSATGLAALIVEEYRINEMKNIKNDIKETICELRQAFGDEIDYCDMPDKSLKAHIKRIRIFAWFSDTSKPKYDGTNNSAPPNAVIIKDKFGIHTRGTTNMNKFCLDEKIPTFNGLISTNIANAKNKVRVREEKKLDHFIAYYKIP